MIVIAVLWVWLFGAVLGAIILVDCNDRAVDPKDVFPLRGILLFAGTWPIWAIAWLLFWRWR